MYVLVALASLVFSALADNCQTQQGVVWGANYFVEFPTSSVGECCNKCDEHPNCVAFTYDTSSNQTCYLKDNVSSNSTNSNRISGLRSSPWVVPRACSTPETSVYPFCDTTLSINTRVDDLISRISPSLKPQLLTARGEPRGNQQSIPNLGVPSFDWGLNCLHGVQSTCVNGRCPTSFANPNGLGASWNMTNALQMGRIIGKETRALWLAGATEYSDWSGKGWIGLDCWSPNININRDPRWGRNQEVPGEDPYLTSQYAIAITQGMQYGEDPRYLLSVTTIKHWDAYSLEDSDGYTRYDFDVEVNNQTLQDTYFPAFKASVIDAGAAGFMCSYNALQGIPTCASGFLKDTLRNQWGFNGYVTSDTDAVANIYDSHHYTTSYQAAACVAITNGGCDINSGATYWDYLLTGVNQSLCSMNDVDAALRRSLTVRFRLGLFDPIADQPYWNYSTNIVNTPESQAFNLFSTQQTLVLLKNDQNTLPFKKGLKVAVVGPHGNASADMLGNYLGQICPDNSNNCYPSLLQSIAKANTGGTTTYSQGCTVTGTSTSGFADALNVAKAADVIVLALGLNQDVESESNDRTQINLPGVQNNFSEQIIALGKPTAIVLLNGGCVALDQQKSSADAILEAFYPGFQGGPAIASALFGDYNPGGKMPYTVYTSDYVNQIKMSNMNMTDAPGRSYKYYTGQPLWPFGWGLSYTTFNLTYSNTTGATAPLSVQMKTGSMKYDGYSQHYEINVTNTGNVAGDEVVQAYSVPSSTVTVDGEAVPLIKQLFGFERVHVAPGQTVTVYFDVDSYDLKLVNKNGDIISAPGDYHVEFTNGVSQTLRSHIQMIGETAILEKW